MSFPSLAIYRPALPWTPMRCNSPRNQAPLPGGFFRMNTTFRRDFGPKRFLNQGPFLESVLTSHISRFQKRTSPGHCYYLIENFKDGELVRTDFWADSALNSLFDEKVQ
jgi:hypothetical protein